MDTVKLITSIENKFQIILQKNEFTDIISTFY